MEHVLADPRLAEWTEIFERLYDRYADEMPGKEAARKACEEADEILEHGQC